MIQVQLSQARLSLIRSSGPLLTCFSCTYRMLALPIYGVWHTPSQVRAQVKSSSVGIPSQSRWQAATWLSEAFTDSDLQVELQPDLFWIRLVEVTLLRLESESLRIQGGRRSELESESRSQLQVDRLLVVRPRLVLHLQVAQVILRNIEEYWKWLVILMNIDTHWIGQDDFGQVILCNIE